MCGPASLKIVLKYYGMSKSEGELYHLCETDPELGTSEEGIRKAAEQLGFGVIIKNESSFEDIEMYLKRDIPVIIDCIF